MKRLMDLTLGDWSNDGHGMTTRYMVFIEGKDVSDQALRKAYEDSCKKLGFSLCDDVLADYQEGSISEDYGKRLKAAGFTLTTLPRDEGPTSCWITLGEEEEASVDVKDLFLWWLKQSMEDLSWTTLEEDGRFFGVKSAMDGVLGYGLYGD